ncbi:MAG: AAA family ATPase, partial [Candidatus Bathyarchaeia archaeon]
MTLSASEELERMAAKYANEAIQLDEQGSKGLAISRYQRAIEILLKLTSLYPDSPQTKVYLTRIEAYQKRIKELRESSTPLGSQNSEVATFNQLVISEKPNVKWDDIADLEEAKKAIEESIIFPVKRPDLFPLGWPKGLLFFGPPGCGKTLLAAAVATEIDAAFYCVDSASIMSKWLGESEKNVAQLFAEARSKASSGQPAIIFIDEIDSLIGKRNNEIGGEIRTRNQFLKEMDGLLDKKKNLHVYVIGATNKPWALDDAFIRRFQKRIYIPLPDYNARLELFKIYTREIKLSPEVDLKYLAKITEGYSGSDIRDIIQTAQLEVVREFFEKGNPNDKRSSPKPVGMGNFINALRKRKPSVSPSLTKNYLTWFE